MKPIEFKVGSKTFLDSLEAQDYSIEKGLKITVSGGLKKSYGKSKPSGDKPFSKSFIEAVDETTRLQIENWEINGRPEFIKFWIETSRIKLNIDMINWYRKVLKLSPLDMKDKLDSFKEMI